jgi:hypothetical protein
VRVAGFDFSLAANLADGRHDQKIDRGSN